MSAKDSNNPIDYRYANQSLLNRIAILEARITDLEAEEERLKAAVAELENENRELRALKGEHLTRPTA